MNSNLKIACLLAIGTCLSTPAWAQETAPTKEGGLEEIIVTAQRRDENLQRAAIAVTAVPSETLKAQVTRAEDLSKLVPSVVIGAGGGGTNLTTVRGIGTLAGNGLAEQTVAFNLDGVYLARPVAANGLFYDLARVEVLKGPQGTLYGRNASAGAINVITQKPKFENSGYFDAKIGNYSLFEGQGAINLKLSEEAAIRISGQGITREGYLSDGYNDQKQYSGRVSLLVKPSADLSLQITGDYVHFGGRGAANVISPFIDPSNPYLGPSNPTASAIYASAQIPLFPGFTLNGLPTIKTDGYNDSNIYGVTGNIGWNTGAGDLTIVSSYRRTDLNYRHYSAGFRVDDVEHSNQKSLEVRFATPEANRLRAVVGAFYFKEDGNFRLDSYLFAPEGGYPGPATVIVNKYNTQSLAVFGQATFALTDTVRLIGGLRYSNEKKDIRGTTPDPFGFFPAGVLDNSLELNKVSWKAGAEADIGPRSLIYATVSNGFKAGGFFAAATPNTFKPEELTSYTIGSKNRFLDNKLQLNIEAFYWKYKDSQVNHLSGSTLVTENAGRATLYGAELEASFLATPNDLLSFNVLYNHTKYDEFTFKTPVFVPWNCQRSAPDANLNVQVDCSGNSMQQTPLWSVNLGYEHTFHLANAGKVVFAASGVYKSSYWLGDERLTGQLQRSYATADLSLTYTAPDDHYHVGAWVRNVGDKAVMSQSFVTSLLAVPVVGLYPPRTYGVTFGANF